MDVSNTVSFEGVTLIEVGPTRLYVAIVIQNRQDVLITAVTAESEEDAKIAIKEELHGGFLTIISVGELISAVEASAITGNIRPWLDKGKEVM